MSIQIIEGRVAQTGPSRLRASRTKSRPSGLARYDCIEFIDTSGETVHIENIDVDKTVEALLYIGQSGCFVISNGRSRELCAIRTKDGREALNSFAAHGRDAYRAWYRKNVIAGSLLSATLVCAIAGLPMLIGAQYVWARAPKKHAKITTALAAAGFTSLDTALPALPADKE